MNICKVLTEPRCNRRATIVWPPSPDGEANTCLTHFRFFTIGEFGEKAIPPWTREQAMEALKGDGLAPEIAEERVNDHFRPEGA
jgi:hypothetical protein